MILAEASPGTFVTLKGACGKTTTTTWAEHVLPMFCFCSFLGNSMNNLLSYCGLIDAKIRASDKDLPVTIAPNFWGLLRKA
jgi:hypothetical protein